MPPRLPSVPPPPTRASVDPVAEAAAAAAPLAASEHPTIGPARARPRGPRVMPAGFGVSRAAGRAVALTTLTTRHARPTVVTSLQPPTSAVRLLTPYNLPQRWPAYADGPHVSARQVWQLLEALQQQRHERRVRQQARIEAASTYVHAARGEDADAAAVHTPTGYEPVAWNEGMPHSGELTWHTGREPLTALEPAVLNMPYARPIDDAWRQARTAVRAALGDVEGFWRALPSHAAITIGDLPMGVTRCAISFMALADLEYPLAIFSAHVPHVFEAQALLAWMQHSLAARPRRPWATNPLDRTPLTLDMLRPVRRAPYALDGPV